MAQLDTFKLLLGNVSDSDAILQFYLDIASDIICDIRNSDVVESKYLNIQIQIATELYNKRGAEGQLQHSENNIVRVYDKGDVSDSLIAKITPIVRTPYSTVRVIT